MPPKNCNIISAYAVINQHESRSIEQATHYQEQINKISSLAILPTTLTIDPLSTPWDSVQKSNHFRSGCAPIMALEHATKLIEQGEQAVIIQGDEPLSSGYSREQRHQLMAVYRDDVSIADLYEQLAQRFITETGITSEDFLGLADNLFTNYLTTHRQQSTRGQTHFSEPSPKWFNHVTPLFRGVDCANPLVDFSAKILLCSDEVARQLGHTPKINVAAVALGCVDTDNEPEAIDIIVQYKHLQRAFKQACLHAKIDFVAQFKQRNALLEAYTCYPVVPMAFLLNNGFVERLQQLPDLLSHHQITITGGMNLARAPWNNPSLYALVSMVEQLTDGPQQYGMVHGNGGLGYRQGVAILEKLS